MTTFKFQNQINFIDILNKNPGKSDDCEDFEAIKIEKKSFFYVKIVSGCKVFIERLHSILSSDFVSVIQAKINYKKIFFYLHHIGINPTSFIIKILKKY